MARVGFASLLAMASCGGPCSKANSARPTTDAATALMVGQDGAAMDDLSSVLEPIREQGSMPALAAAVWRSGKMIAIGVSGFRKSGDPTPATVDDPWHLGSDTKAMTATLIGIHVDRGTLHYEDTLASLFVGEKLDGGYATVTLEQILQHRGGAPGDVPRAIWSAMWKDGDAPDARIKAVRAMLAMPPAQAPGTFVYANAGYMIAGAALERVTGKTWESLMREDLFAPLHMDGCGFGAPGSASVVDAPWGHTSGLLSLVPMPPGPRADNPLSIGPAGTVHCSLADWGKFLTMHVAGARGEPTLLSAATMKRLHTPPAGGDYAQGWSVLHRSWGGPGVVLTHAGSNTMWFAVTWLAPDKDLAFAVVTNRAKGNTDKLVDGVFAPLIKNYADPR